MNAFLSDFKYALRRLRRSPGFLTAALLTLALGIGASAVLFSFVDRTFLHPMTYLNPDRVVIVTPKTNQGGMAWQPISGRQFLAISKETKRFLGFAALRDTRVVLRSDVGLEHVSGCLVSPGGLTILGVPFAMGRDFREEDAGQGGTGLAILPFGVWQRRFGGDPKIIGSNLYTDGKILRVTGVLAKGVKLPMLAEGKEILLPLTFTPDEIRNNESASCWVMGSLKPGEGIQAGRTELQGLSPSIAPLGSLKEGWALEARTLRALDLEIQGPFFAVLGSLTFFILLLTCANVAGLNLARIDLKSRESAMRAALGASRGQILRAPFSEVIIISMGAGAVVLLTMFVISKVSSGYLIGVGESPLRLDLKQASFTFFIALLASLGAGLAPAIVGSRANIWSLLQLRSVGGSRMKIRKGMVIFQVALATVLLIGAGLMGRAVWRLKRIDIGFNPAGVLTAQFAEPSYSSNGQFDPHRHYFDAVVERLRGIPGVEATGVAEGMPLYNRADKVRYWVEGNGAEPLQASSQRVSAGYFRAMGIGILRGRSFEDWETGLCVVSDPLAQRCWPGQDPLGKRISIDGPAGPWKVVVGVARAHRHNSVTMEATEQILSSFRENGSAYYAILLRTSGNPAALALSVRSAMEGLAVLDSVEPLQAVVERNLSSQKLLGWALSAFGLLAGLLAAIGIHGVASSHVQQRRREFGLRMALGAQRSQIMRHVIRQALQQVGIGIGFGWVASLALGRMLQSLLTGLNLWDLPSLFAASLTLCILALAASLEPAIKATLVDPSITLHAE